MKISSVYSVVGQYNLQRTEAVQAKPKAYSSSDKVELSANARLFTEALATLKGQMQQDAPERINRVNEVMNRVRSGGYSVDTLDICDKLLA